MLPPQEQWCHQIAVTSACWPKPACSNCTRLLGHESKRYYMTLDQFETILKVAAPFLHHSPPERGLKQNRGNPAMRPRKKVLGIFGGEPLMHPKFPELVDLMCKYVPKKHRGLWTSFDWAEGESKVYGPYRPHVERLLGENPGGNVFDDSDGGYLNWNMHEESQSCHHSPVLVAINDVEKDEKKKWDTIEKCWVQTEWSAAYALDYNLEPKFYFCEVASSFDRVFNLGTGLPVEEGVWSHHLWFERDDKGILRPKGPYKRQIQSTCGRCGCSLKLQGRRDREFTDDISPSNLVALKGSSPMVRKGQYVEHDGKTDSNKKSPEPWEYLKEDNREHQRKNFERSKRLKSWITPNSRGVSGGN